MLQVSNKSNAIGRGVYSNKNPQKTQNGAQLNKVSKNVEMRPNQILRSKTPKLSVQQINAIKRSPAGALPRFLEKATYKQKRPM